MKGNVGHFWDTDSEPTPMDRPEDCKEASGDMTVWWPISMDILYNLSSFEVPVTCYTLKTNTLLSFYHSLSRRDAGVFACPPTPSSSVLALLRIRVLLSSQKRFALGQVPSHREQMAFISMAYLIGPVPT